MPLFIKEDMALLRGLGLEGVDQLLPIIDALDVQIARISGSLRRMSGEDPRARLLTTIPGVGYYIALLLISEIGDVRRFPDSEKLCSYAGIVPSTYSSGGVTSHGRITREGSSWLRWAMLEAVQTHLRYDTPVTRAYHRIAERRGKGKAKVALAHILLFWI